MSRFPDLRSCRPIARLRSRHPLCAVPLALLLLVLLTSLRGDAAAEVRFDIVAAQSPRDSLEALEVGDLVTIDIRLVAGETPFPYWFFYLIEGGAYGFDTSIVEFVDGEVVDRLFWQACATPEMFPPLGGCFGRSIENQYAGRVGLIEYPYYAVPYVAFLSGSGSLPSETYANSLDPGLDGIPGGGDAHARLRFRMIGLGATSIVVGTAPVRPIDGALCCDVEDRIGLRVIPEPGPALLLGLGLGMLGLRRRRT